MGAAGPNHLVSLLNSDFGVFDKTTGAVLQSTISLQSFWGSLGTGAGEPADFPFDTKILYDQHSGRFVAITLGGTSAPDSWVMVAVSSTSDPTGAWSKWAIDADLDNDVQTFNNSADFPGLGVDAFNVYVTANMFNGGDVGQYSKVWVIPKAQLLSGSPPSRGSNSATPPGCRFHHAARPHLRGRRPRSTSSSRDRPTTCAVARIDNTSGTPSGTPRCRSPVTAYASSDPLPGAPQSGQRQHDRHVGHAPAERGLPERLGLGHPPRRRPERESRGRLVPDQPGNRHGAVAGAGQRPEPLVLLPLHRGQQGQRRRDRVQRLVDHRIRRGVLHHRPAVHRHRGSRWRC